MLIIDIREKALIGVCKRLYIPHKVQRMRVGDASNTGQTFIAEINGGKKGFFFSLQNKRLYAQVREMYEYCKDNRYLFVRQGVLNIKSDKDVSWYYDIFGEIENWQVQFREFVDYRDLARKLYSLERQLGTERKVYDREVKMYKATVAKRMVAQLPRVGSKLSEKILKECGNFLNFINLLYNDVDKILAIRLVGKKIVEQIKEEIEIKHE